VIRCLTIPMMAALFCVAAAPAGAYYIQYDYTVNAPDGTPAPLTGAQYLYDQTYYADEIIQHGDAQAGNWASASFLADIFNGEVRATTSSHGVYLTSYDFYYAQGRVEHIKFQDELIFTVPPGSYPDGLYVTAWARVRGYSSSEVGAGAEAHLWFSVGSDAFNSGSIGVGVGDHGVAWIDTVVTLRGAIAHPGSNYVIPVETEVSVVAYIHRCLNWSVEYNTGSGYVTGDGSNDYYHHALVGKDAAAKDASAGISGVKVLGFSVPEGVSWTSASGVFLEGLSDVPDSDPVGTLPQLRQNHPNPFNPRTLIDFELPRPATVELRIYSAQGRLVRTLLAGEQRGEGPHQCTWNGRDDTGRPAAAGVYLYRLRTGDHTESRRMVLVR